mmetsp:Transcript_80119/g.259527  ORF Transcript_80119/g.259527 Transcript_80119/m.259527 type:complete len:364 (+) Transcript_80119:165-1256(+)
MDASLLEVRHHRKHLLKGLHASPNRYELILLHQRELRRDVRRRLRHAVLWVIHLLGKAEGHVLARPAHQPLLRLALLRADVFQHLAVQADDPRLTLPRVLVLLQVAWGPRRHDGLGVEAQELARRLPRDARLRPEPGDELGRAAVVRRALHEPVDVALGGRLRVGDLRGLLRGEVLQVDHVHRAVDHLPVVALCRRADAVVAPLLLVDLLHGLRRHPVQHSVGAGTRLRHVGGEAGVPQELELEVHELCGHALHGLQVPAVHQDVVHQAAGGEVPDSPVERAGKAQLPLSRCMHHLRSHGAIFVDLISIGFLSALGLEARPAYLPTIEHLLHGLAGMKPADVLLNGDSLILCTLHGALVDTLS